MGTELSRWNPDDIELILRGITVSPAEMKTMQGMSVYHGTIDSEIFNVRMGPKNIGKGFGGSGLYVDVDYAVADAYGFMKGQFSGKPVVLKGSLKFSEKTRLARIRIADRYQLRSVNFAKGIFPPDWAKDPTLQSLMHKHFDAIEVVGTAESYATLSDRFLVIHERAGAEVIDWSSVRYKNKAWEALPEMQRYRRPFLTFDEKLEAAIALKRLPDYTAKLGLPDYYSTKPHPIHIEPKTNTWFHRVVDAGYVGILFKCLHYGLSLGEGAIRYWDDSVHYPDLSSGAHFTAAGTGMALDLGIFERLAHVMRPGLALSSLMVTNELSHVAYEMRDVNYKELSERRHVLLKLLDLYEIEGEAQQHLIDDFDRGGSISRRFVESAFNSTWPIQKTLEYIYRGKEAVIGLGRVVGQELSDYEQAISQRYSFDERAVNVMNDHLLGVNYIMREKAQLPIYFMDKAPENKDDDSLPMPEQVETDEASLNDADSSSTEEKEINKEALKQIEEALKLADGVISQESGMNVFWKPRGTSVAASSRVLFGSDAAAKEYKHKMKLEKFYSGLHHAYHMYRLVEKESAQYERCRRDLMDQLTIAKRLLGVNALEYLPSYYGAGRASDFANHLVTLSSDHWMLGLVENQRHLKTLESDLDDVKQSIARHESYQQHQNAIQSDLNDQVDGVNQRIETLLTNPALQFLNHWAGLNKYIGNEIQKEHDEGQKDKVRSAEKQQEDKIDEMEFEADEVDKELQEAWDKLHHEQRNLGRIGSVASELKGSQSYVRLQLTHLENRHFELKMQQINLSSFSDSPESTLKFMSELHTDLIEKEGNRKAEYDQWNDKKTKWELALEEENKLEHPDPIKVKQFEIDIENATIKLGDLGSEIGGITKNKETLERQQARIERQKPMRQAIYNLKMGAVKAKFPTWTESQIEEYLSDQALSDEWYQLELRKIHEATHGYHSVIMSSSQLVASLVSFIAHEGKGKWMTPELQVQINAVVNCAGRLFDIGVTIANITTSISRALQEGFGFQNILSTIVSPGIGIFNTIFGIIRAFNPLPDPVLENLNAISKQMAEGLGGLAQGIDQLGKMSQLSLKQNQYIITLLQDGFLSLSVSAENAQLTQISYLSEIQKKLDNMVKAAIEQPHLQVVAEVRSRAKLINDTLKLDPSVDEMKRLISKFNNALKRNISAEADDVYQPHQSLQQAALFTHADTLIKSHLNKAGVKANRKQQLPLQTTLQLNRRAIKTSRRLMDDSQDASLLARLDTHALLQRSQALYGAYADLKKASVFREAFLKVINDVNACHGILEEAIHQPYAMQSVNEAHSQNTALKSTAHRYESLQVALWPEGKIHIPLSVENLQEGSSYDRVWRKYETESHKKVIESRVSNNPYYQKVGGWSGEVGRFAEDLGLSLRSHHPYMPPWERYGEDWNQYLDYSCLNFKGGMQTHASLSTMTVDDGGLFNFKTYSHWQVGHNVTEATFINPPKKFVYACGDRDFRKQVIIRAGDVVEAGSNKHYSPIPLASVLARSVALREQEEGESVKSYQDDRSEQSLHNIQAILDLLRPMVVQGETRSSALSKLDIQSSALSLAKDICAAFILEFMQPYDYRYSREFNRVKNIHERIQEKRKKKEETAELIASYYSVVNDEAILNYCAKYIQSYIQAVSDNKMPIGLNLLRLLCQQHEDPRLHRMMFQSDNPDHPSEVEMARTLSVFAPWHNPFLIDVLRDRALGESYYNRFIEASLQTYQDCIQWLEEARSDHLTDDQKQALKDEALLIYPEGNGSHRLIPLLVKRSDMRAFIDLYLTSIHERQRGVSVDPMTAFRFQYVVDVDKNTKNVLIGLNLYHQMEDGQCKLITKEKPLPYREIDQATFWYYAAASRYSVDLGGQIEFDKFSSECIEALNILLVQLQSPFREAYLVGSESIWPINKIYGISDYFKYKPGSASQSTSRNSPKFEDEFERWEDYAHPNHYSDEIIELNNPAKLPIPKIRRFPGLFQLTVAHGQTFVFSHHAYTANAASVWCHPLMQQKNRLGDFIKPVPAEMLKSMEMPSPQALQIIRDDRLEPALLKLRDSVYTFLGLFSLAVDIDHHSDILAQLGLNDLLAIIHFHHEPTKVEKVEDVIASFVSANGSDNALLDVLMDYYANVLEFSERAKLNELKMQMNALDAISRAKSSAQRVHGLFGGASPKTPASDTINRSASPGIAKVANTFDDDSGDLRTKPYAKR